MCECLLFKKNCMITHNQLHNETLKSVSVKMMHSPPLSIILKNEL